MHELFYFYLMKVNLLLIFLVFFSLKFTAQDEAQAKKLFIAGNFIQALNEYDVLIGTDSANKEWLYHMSVCYLNTNGDKSRAVPLLEKLLLDVNPKPVYLYLMGRAYHYGYNFSSAIEYFKMLGSKFHRTIFDYDKNNSMIKELIKDQIS